MPRSGALPFRPIDRLPPGPEDLDAVRSLPSAYRRMLVMLAEIRRERGLRADVATLGIGNLARPAAGFDPERVTSMPLDDTLFSVKSALEIALSTLHGRRTMPDCVEGHDGPWRDLSGDALTIQVGVSVTAPNEETRMTETILTRVGRIIGGLSNAALDAVEDRNPLAVAEQALREIDAVIHEARLDLGRIKAEEHRLTARRDQLDGERAALPEKLALALANGREDLARAGISRQLDLESQIEAIASSLGDVAERHAAATAARRDAEHRIALLRRPPATAADPLDGYGSGEAARTRQLEQSLRAIDRATGTASAVADPSVEELDRLHRDDAIERRLAALKQGRPS